MGTLTTALRRDASGRTFPLPTPFSSPHSWLRATPESCDELRCSTSRARHRRTSCPSAWRRYERASVACGHPCRTFLLRPGRRAARRLRVASTCCKGARAVDERGSDARSEEHTSELQSLAYLVCRLLLEKKKKTNIITHIVT